LVLKDLNSIQVGWLIDGSGNPAQKKVRILVKAGRIAAVQKVTDSEEIVDKSNPRPAGDLDLSGCTVLPGLIDIHAHLAISGTVDPIVRLRQLTAPYLKTKGVICRHIRRHLSAGILAIRDGGDAFGHTLRYKASEGMRQAVPVQVKVAGRAWHKPNRYGRIIGRAVQPPNTLAEAIAHATEKKDHIKVVNSGVNSLSEFGKETLPQFGIDELKAAVSAAEGRNLKVMVHANGHQAVHIAVEAGCHSIEHGFFMGTDNLKAMADRNIYWIPTAVTMQAYCRYLNQIGSDSAVARKNLDHQLAQLAEAHQLRVPVVVGTDAGSPGVEHGRAFVEEMQLLLEAGFSIEEVVRSGTYNGASLLAITEMGLLVPGMPATFIAVSGNPSDLPHSLRRIKGIYLNGALLDSSAGGR
jgi:imidazolonepropionase-like amidohydrolase